MKPEGLQVLIEDCPQALCATLNKYGESIKVLAIVQYGTRQAAYVIHVKDKKSNKGDTK